jgi:DNA-binding transcriptional ArsR family regulator
VVVHAEDQGLTAQSNVDRTLLALADPTRRGVIELLRSEPRRASELAELLSMTRPAMSRHLRVLRKSGLVSESEPDHDARVRMYRLERERFAELRDWLDEVEAYWGEQLGAFKAYAEKRGKARKK